MNREVLLTLIEKSGKSKNAIENEIGIANGKLNHYLNDYPSQKRCDPSEAYLVKLADYFNVSIDYLVGRVEPAQTLTSPVVKSAEPVQRILSPKLQEINNDWNKLSIEEQSELYGEFRAYLKDKQSNKRSSHA